MSSIPAQSSQLPVFTKEELKEMSSRPFSQGFTAEHYETRLKQLPPEQRNEVVGLRKIHFRLEDFAERKICLKCWTKKHKCICEKVQKVNLRHNILLFMHYREYGRQTNTGKILTICSERTQLYTYGIQEEEQALLDRLKANPETSFVLFPSPDSISVDQFLSKFAKPTPSAEKGKNVVENVAEGLQNMKVADFPPLNIVIIDGTWNQAKHLVYHIPPEVPRVHLNPTSPSLFLLRKQSQSDRICTLEATSLLLKELEDDDHLFQTLIDNLKLSVDSVLKDRGLNPAYGKLEGHKPSKKMLKKKRREESESNSDEEEGNEEKGESSSSSRN